MNEPKLGFVLNFGSNLMKDGIERVVNGLSEENLGVSAASRDTLPRCCQEPYHFALTFSF